MIDATILGAGVAGLCCAAELASRGVRVQIIDPKGPPGPHGCSWWAGGMLAPGCEAEHAPEQVVRHGKRAADWWAQFTEVHKCGTLVVAPARDRGELSRFSRVTPGWQRASVPEKEPDLHDFAEGLFYPEEAHLDPREALSGLCRFLQNKSAAILTSAEPAGQVIDCRGLAAREELGDLRGVRGEMLVLRSAEIHLSRPVRLLHPRMPLYVVPRAGGIFMVGATMIEAEDKQSARVRSVLELLSAAYALNPAFAEAEVVEIGADLRPAFPDNLPRVRRKGDIIYANGLYRHGYLMAPALARCVADYVTQHEETELFDADYH